MSDYPEELVDRLAEVLQGQQGGGVVYWKDLSPWGQSAYLEDVRTILHALNFHEETFVLAGRTHTRWVATTPWVEK